MLLTMVRRGASGARQQPTKPTWNTPPSRSNLQAVSARAKRCPVLIRRVLRAGAEQGLEARANDPGGQEEPDCGLKCLAPTTLTHTLFSANDWWCRVESRRRQTSAAWAVCGVGGAHVRSYYRHSPLRRSSYPAVGPMTIPHLTASHAMAYVSH
eukprot:776876-Rhodomonas_salina.4